MRSKSASLLWRCGKLKGVKPRALLVAWALMPPRQGQFSFVTARDG